MVAAVALILSTGSLFTIWSVPNDHAAVVGVSCLFSAVTVTVFGALDVVNMNTYDVNVRCVLHAIFETFFTWRKDSNNLDSSQTYVVVIVPLCLEISSPRELSHFQH